MPESFVQPAPNIPITKMIGFDFPAEGSQEVDPASTYRATGTPPNVNLAKTGVEAIYGLLGNPGREQGHPFMREASTFGGGGETDDPISVDQIVDTDRGMELAHTGRLSGDLVPLLASKPSFSLVKITAVTVSPVSPHASSIIINPGIMRWLEPQAQAPNEWFYRPGTTTHELLFTAHQLITTQIGEAPYHFRAEHVYKLVFHWEFWRDIGDPPYPDTPPTPGPDATRRVARLPISGFDESIAFQVSTGNIGII